jgi:hypothetical protein
MSALTCRVAERTQTHVVPEQVCVAVLQQTVSPQQNWSEAQHRVPPLHTCPTGQHSPALMLRQFSVAALQHRVPPQQNSSEPQQTAPPPHTWPLGQQMLPCAELRQFSVAASQQAVPQQN